MPCSRLDEYCRPEASTPLEHVSRRRPSRLGSVARQGMEAESPSRVSMLETIDFLKGLSGSAKIDASARQGCRIQAVEQWRSIE